MVALNLLEKSYNGDLSQANRNECQELVEPAIKKSVDLITVVKDYSSDTEPCFCGNSEDHHACGAKRLRSRLVGPESLCRGYNVRHTNVRIARYRSGALDFTIRSDA